MKTVIIFVQSAALLFAGWLTRPPESDFTAFVHRHMAAKADGLLPRTAADAYADTYVKQCVFRDRWLWVEVVKDNKVAHIGVLAHWFDRDMVERTDMSKGFAINSQ